MMKFMFENEEKVNEEIKEAKEKIIDKVISVVKNWKEYAKFAGISKAEQDFMQGAFVLVNNA